MTENTMSTTTSAPTVGGDNLPQAPRAKTVPLHQLHALPVPIRTFPLPTFYPSNPVSLVHLVFTWLRQATFPPPAEPSKVHTGIWDPATRSVHIQDHGSMRALWEQGFYGKGSLSRSEPNWLKREQIRRGVVAGNVIEEHTTSRREERRVAKWERARIEQEAIERTRFEEAQSAASDLNALVTRDMPLRLPVKPPVGPLELLALPNSQADLHNARVSAKLGDIDAEERGACCSNGTLLPPPAFEKDAATMSELSNSLGHSKSDEPQVDREIGGGMNGHLDGTAEPSNGSILPASPLPAEEISNPNPPRNGSEQQPLKHRKSVRFSPKVESTTFQHSDPPNPNHPPASTRNGSAHPTNGLTVEPVDSPLDLDEIIANKEHLQLSPEEAFFLVFAIGALSVVDPTTNSPIPPEHLLTLFRSHSYFPPRAPDTPVGELHPHDPFLVHYAVYHHFRSMGWVPRHGIKFGVDWMLYQRGPAFDHAEFGIIVIPSFSDPWWREHGYQPPQKSWRWLHGINRVMSHVLKSLVLVYVDIPPPPAFNAAMAKSGTDGAVVAALNLYRIREVMVRRWSSNRNR